MRNKKKKIPSIKRFRLERELKTFSHVHGTIIKILTKYTRVCVYNKNFLSIFFPSLDIKQEKFYDQNWTFFLSILTISDFFLPDITSRVKWYEWVSEWGREEIEWINRERKEDQIKKIKKIISIASTANRLFNDFLRFFLSLLAYKQRSKKIEAVLLFPRL